MWGRPCPPVPPIFTVPASPPGATLLVLSVTTSAQVCEPVRHGLCGTPSTGAELITWGPTTTMEKALHSYFHEPPTEI